jgi:nucleoside-diphosphate-sugar epimerase
VRVVDKFSNGKEENLINVINEVDLIHRDIRDYDIVERAIRGVDIVVHLAAMVDVHKSMKDPLLYHEVNVGGTLNLLNLARGAVERLTDPRQVRSSASNLKWT